MNWDSCEWGDRYTYTLEFCFSWYPLVQTTVEFGLMFCADLCAACLVFDKIPSNVSAGNIVCSCLKIYLFVALDLFLNLFVSTKCPINKIAAGSFAWLCTCVYKLLFFSPWTCILFVFGRLQFLNAYKLFVFDSMPDQRSCWWWYTLFVIKSCSFFLDLNL